LLPLTFPLVPARNHRSYMSV